MTQEFVEGMRSLLDQFTVPAPRAGFSDAIVAAAEAAPTSSPVTTVWPRSPARSAWARRTMIGTMMMVSAVSAAAAAAGGWFGERAVQLPVISAIATVIPDIVKAKPKAKAETRVAAKPIPKPVPPPTPKTQDAKAAPVAPVAGSTLPVTAMRYARQEARQERIAAKLTHRLDLRDARRAARGLAPNTGQERALLEQFRAAKSVEDRQAARASLRQLRMERRARFQERSGETIIDQAVQSEAFGVRRAEHYRRPMCSPEQASTPRLNGCRLPRRACADIPAGAWTPPRCRGAGRLPDAP